MAYFSQRELGPTPRTKEDLMPGAWLRIVQSIWARMADGSFGREFPKECDWCRATAGTDLDLMSAALKRDLVYLAWPADAEQIPHLYDALDLVEFCHRTVSKQSEGTGYCNKIVRHLAFDDEEGKREFRTVINGIFAREGLAFHLDENGEVSRVGPLVLSDALASSVFKSGDRELDRLLEVARQKFVSHDAKVRRESLEKLWDAWERLKSIENPNNKKDSTTKLLDRACIEPRFRDVLEVEARMLTNIGNDFMIRHTEVNKVLIANEEQVDYLFHKMFAMIRLLLRSTNRGG